MKVYKTAFHPLIVDVPKRLRHLYAMWFGLLGAFRKQRKANISFVMYFGPSACLCVLMEPLGTHWTDFHEITYLNTFISKTSRGNSSFINTVVNKSCNFTYVIWQSSEEISLRMTHFLSKHLGD